ncbi:matrixin family metalloprotease [Knoellia subterranea]|uniref:Peptidase M10 metallopeptidase domain-containing protein n=1 Tax=Knoellia subterranea KCTC 19937 TaxID=1385521 RepID=A0A0A0JS17_9MICO|nr:matrixin family metalloprotease [Knoellia subterranea]KGN38862.1 hypothetical protein N803_07580 [Knoellia subterranea KCTC 19937]
MRRVQAVGAFVAGALLASGGALFWVGQRERVADNATWQQPVVTIDDKQAVAVAQQWDAPFEIRYAAADPDIDVVRGVTGWDTGTGSTVGGKAFPPTLDGDRITHCAILVNHEHVTDAVLAHEIGHCLGLHHSTDPARLMYEVTGSPRSAIGVTDADRTALRRLYSD